ncbi:hypothetical protein QBC41DRAFT_15470 [Cercophora samala]|uniref:Uncharacterized protein n=1 Tax=Cercophora samala TaxID=330535 RepID=A0AA39Z6Z5_9PEZI|nr:hypothetical protein QBC41DRAFT_15470 [Cercophora samala]
MSPSPPLTSQTIDDSDSEIEVMADFRVVPDTPFWEVPGFLFEAESVERIESQKKRIWKALICPDYTTMPKGSANNAKPEQITKLRVRNNVALLFRALLFFCDYRHSPTYWTGLSPDTFSGSGEEIMRLLERTYVQARRAYVKQAKESRMRSYVALYADKYIEFLDSADEDLDSPSLTKTELRDHWAELKKKGALMNLSQHKPNDIEDDSSDDELLTLPGERLAAESRKSNKRKNPATAPVTPRPSKRQSTSSTRPSTNSTRTATASVQTTTKSTRPSARSVRVVSPPSSPPIPRFDSATGLSPAISSEVSDAESFSSPIFGRGTPSAPAAEIAQRKTNQRFTIIDSEINNHSITLKTHGIAIESLKADIALQQGRKQPAELTTAVDDVIERKLKEKKQAYTTRVVANQVNAVKVNLGERLESLDSKLEGCVGKIAVEGSKRKDIEAELGKVRKNLELVKRSGHSGHGLGKLEKKVKRYRNDHKTLARDVTSRLVSLENHATRAESSDAVGESGGDEDRPNSSRSTESRLATLEEEIVSLKLANERLTNRIVALEKRGEPQRWDSYNSRMAELNRSRPREQTSFARNMNSPRRRGY